MWKSTHDRLLEDKQRHADRLALELVKRDLKFSVTDKEAKELMKGA